MHASIPTTYRGIRFRSRLEAKWAAHADLDGSVRWKYEPIEFPGWIPDFSWEFIGRSDKPALVEVKPVYTLESFLTSADCLKMFDAVLANPLLANNFHGFFLLGVSPEHVWANRDFGGNSSRWRQLSLPDIEEQHCWAKASNITQWKAPQ